MSRTKTNPQVEDAGGAERRVFEREDVRITFIYSLDPGETILQGEWYEAQTVDIGPVLVGGLAFYSKTPIEIGREIRIALFIDLELKRAWETDQEGFPPIYHGKVVRTEKDLNGHRIAVAFKGFEQS